MADYSRLAQALQGDQAAAMPDQGRWGALRAAFMPGSNANFDYPNMGAALNETDQQARLSMYGPQAGLQANLRAEAGKNWDNEVAAQPAREAAAASSLRDALLSLTPAAPAVAAKDAYNSAQNGDWLGTALGMAGTLPLVGMAAKGVNEARIASRIHPTEKPEFKNWFGAGKVVDAEGKPLVVYHGTNAKSIDAFDPERIGSKTDSGWLGHGFYFTSDKSAAEAYGNNQIPVYLSPQNLYDMNGKNFAKVLEAHGGPQGFSEWLNQNGYDGAKMWSQYMVMDPTKIKSAIGNRGAFDPTDPRITYGIGGMGVATYGNDKQDGK